MGSLWLLVVVVVVAVVIVVMVVIGGEGFQEVLRLEGSRDFSVNRGALGM